MWDRQDDISENGRRSLSKRKNIFYYTFLFPVAVLPKAWVCNCSLVGIAGSNLIIGMDISLPLVCVLCPQVQLPSIDKSTPQG